MKLYRSLIPEKIRLPIFQARKHSLIQLHRSLTWLTDPSVMFMRSRLEKFRGAYTGKRCFIMGNGPSLNQMNLELFKDEIVWGSNRCYLLFDKINWRPKFYVAVDGRVVPDNANDLNSLPKKIPDTCLFYPSEFRYKGILNSGSNVYWYQEKLLSEENLPYSMFSVNPPDFVYSVYTVTVAMLQLAAFMGFTPIYLIGCDTNYIVPDTVQFENGDSFTLISTENDPNHFDSSYFGKDKKWHYPLVEKMLVDYESAKKVCDKINIQIINATVGGKLEVFPRVDYLELFN